jgi:NADPH:quinone reductase-like Zn-dependent oxidoreductase
MYAVRFSEYGDPTVLRRDDVPIPEPDAGQVRIRVAATSFNGIDASIRGGGMQGPFPVVLPHTPGIDVAGIVDALGVGVDRFAVGDRVVGFLSMLADGAAAEYVVTPADVLTAAPTSIPLTDAAALPAVALTAHQAIVEHAEVRPGQRVLVNGAGGAVGAYAVQFARRAGAHVIATSSDRSRDRVLASGADEVVDRTVAPVVEQVGSPVDVLLNLAPVDPEQFAALGALVRDGGVIVNTTVWMPAPADEARGVRGIDLFVRSDATELAGIVELVDRGEVRVDVTDRVALDALPSVHEDAAAGRISGKVVVVVDPDPA